MKQIAIKVPNWFPLTNDFRKFKRKLTKWIFPPRCVGCNKRLKSPEFYWKHSRVGTHPLGFKNTTSTFGIRVSRPYCIGCMKTYLHTLNKEIGNCTICETKNVPVMGYTFIKEPKTFITFLWQWWNGSTFCMNCVDEMLNNGQEATDGTY